MWINNTKLQILSNFQEYDIAHVFFIVGELFTCTAFHCKGNFDIFKFIATKNLNGVMGEL